MATIHRTRNAMLLGVIESPAGTEGSPSVGSNAIKVRQPIGYSPNFAALDTDFVQASLDQSAPIVGGGMVAMRLQAFLKGSGTGGTAPDWGTLLRACGMSLTTLGSALTGTAQAGAAGSITLASSGPSSTNDAYRGMAIRTTGGTGSGQKRIITGYNGTTKVATVTPAWTTTPDGTTEYSIDACNVYRPVSAGLEAITLFAYQLHSTVGSNARLRKLKGGMGSFSLAVRPRELGTIDFNIQGQLPAVPTDVSAPGSPTYQSSEPAPFVGASAYLGGAAVAFSEFSFDMGGQVAQFDDPSATYGYDIGEIIARQPSGRIVPNTTLLSSRDAFSDWLASTSRDLWLDWGPAAGKRISMYFPALRYTGNEPTDVRGFAAEGIPFRSVEADAGVFLSVY